MASEDETMSDPSDQTLSSIPSMGAPAGEGDQPEMIHRQTTTHTFKKTYTKTFWHYISNNPERENNFTFLNREGFVTLAIDFGAQYVPYDNCRTTMRPQD